MSDSALPAVLRAIRARGPIPFAEFMAIALGDLETGYYTGAPSRPTRDGDFLTAPELHPIFGAAVARQLHEAWERLGSPDRFTLVEYGAGAGTLVLAILDGLRADKSGLAAALRYAPVELNAHRRVELEARAAAAGLPLATVGTGVALTGAVLANEFLDALPVHVVEWRADGLREVHVAATPDGSLAEMLGDPSTPALAARLAELAADGVALVEGQRAEICLALDAWAADAAGRFERGLVLVIDYGAPAVDLYGPRRRGGTLMTYRRHVADGSRDGPYRDVGDRDLTAHVDTSTLRRRLVAAGLDDLGETSQGRFLAGAGLEDLLERERAHATSVEAWALLRAAIIRLLDPRHLGGFRVVAAGRGLDAAVPLRGFAAGGGSRTG